MIVDSQIEDDAEFQCQVGATERSAGIRSNTAQLSVLCEYINKFLAP